MTDKKESHDLIQRGVHGPSPAGTLTFVGLRGIDPFIQYKILTGGGAALLSKVGISSIVPAAAFTTGVSLIDKLELPLSHLLLLGMSIGSAVKQAYWLVALSKEQFPPAAALTVTAFNTVVNAANSLILIATPTSSTLSTSFPGTDIPWPYVVGPVLYVTGMILETGAEIQRRTFKDSPEGKGKVMKTGLWSWARHINYGGYSLWRGAYAMTAGGLGAGLLMGGFQAYDFVTRAVPVLDGYCSDRYGEQWTNFKKEVKWVILPGIY